MEFLRKAGEKSEDRMSVIVEAGALALVSNVSPLSPTSNNDNASTEPSHKKGFIEEPRCSLPVPKMSSHVNTNIQHKLIKSLVLMILFATGGFVMWNGEEWKASYKKRAEEEEKKKEEERVSSRRSQYNEVLRVHFNGEGSPFYQEYYKKFDKLGEENYDFSVNEIKLLLDSLREWRDSIESECRPDFFFDSLIDVELVWKLYVKNKFPGVASIDESNYELDDSICDVAKIILDYMQEFSKEYPKFSNSKDYVEFKKKYNYSKRDLDVMRLHKIPCVVEQNSEEQSGKKPIFVKQNDFKLDVLTFWEKKIGVKK